MINLRTVEKELSLKPIGLVLYSVKKFKFAESLSRLAKLLLNGIHLTKNPRAMVIRQAKFH